ncbi:AAA family ATPase [Methanobacterium petrolearium]|uniref:AAA family ATPase n=1 Tax=Methanobacterium petrolearium TaxID=710190 RepID=UPI003081C0FD|nr:hypothetical protein GCM10025861_15270 [Methanobacterium petrolearium]
MGDIIKELKIPNDSYFFISDEGKKGKKLMNLSKINIFIGENNSGKSRLLRHIIKEDVIHFVPSNKDFDKLNLFIPEINTKMKKEFKKYQNIDIFKPIFDNLPNKKLDFLISGEDPCYSIVNSYNAIKKLETEKSSSLDGTRLPVFGKQMKELFEVYFKEYFKKYRSIEELQLKYEFIKVYIPILRGLRPINYGESAVSLKGEKIYPPEYIDRDVYKIRTIADYFVLDETNIKKQKEFDDNIVFSGLNAYQEIRKHMLNENDKDREMIEEFEVYLSENFFGYEKVKLTPAENQDGTKKDVILVKIGKEQGKPIYDLGDGIQSIIIITLPLFLYKDKIKDNKKVLMFIEEPEHLLHPSLQRKLIETFNQKRFEDFQFFFTTHSNHFLDISLDFEGISMFTVNKYLDDDNNPNFLVENVDFGDNNLLNLLGIRSSSVFLPNCNIWVEGPTDAFYIRRYLNIYQDYMKRNNKNFIKFDEDRHYSFYIYNGSDLSNLLDLSLNNEDRRINRLLLIRDGDTEKDKKKRNIMIN